MDGGDVVAVVFVVVVALPWLVLHYITRWKTAATLTNDDESLLDELYQLARRLDDRMDTVERLVAADNPDFERSRLLPDHEADTVPMREIEQLRSGSKRKTEARR